MAELQSELEQTIRRIENIQRGGNGYGARANRAMNFGGSQGSRGSSNNSRTNSNTRQPSYQSKPYQRPSYDRSGSGGRNNSLTRSGGSQKKDKYLPGNYKPPHMRSGSNTRVSPVRSSGYGPQPAKSQPRISPARPS